MRERTSQLEKRLITALYYYSVTGELAKLDQTYQEWMENYPGDNGACSNLANNRWQVGEHAECVQLSRESLRILSNVVSYENLEMCLMAQGRRDKARKTFEEAMSRKLDDDMLNLGLYDVAVGHLIEATVAVTPDLFTK